jgi:hypothetical protein
MLSLLAPNPQSQPSRLDLSPPLSKPSPASEKISPKEILKITFSAAKTAKEAYELVQSLKGNSDFAAFDANDLTDIIQGIESYRDHPSLHKLVLALAEHESFSLLSGENLGSFIIECIYLLDGDSKISDLLLNHVNFKEIMLEGKQGLHAIWLKASNMCRGGFLGLNKAPHWFNSTVLKHIHDHPLFKETWEKTTLFSQDLAQIVSDLKGHIEAKIRASEALIDLKV